MIFRRQQREKVMEEFHIRDSAAVNTVLGQMVSVLVSYWTYVHYLID